MSRPTSLEAPVPWNATGSTHAHQAAQLSAVVDTPMSDRTNGRYDASYSLDSRLQYAKGASTPLTPISSSTNSALDNKGNDCQDISRYIALGCLHIQQPCNTNQKLSPGPDWAELIYHGLPDEIKLIIGNEASRLLEERWIRLFLLRQLTSKPDPFAVWFVCISCRKIGVVAPLIAVARL